MRQQRTDPDYLDLIELVRGSDAELGEHDGSEHSFYAQYNKMDVIRYVVIAYHS